MTKYSKLEGTQKDRHVQFLSEWPITGFNPQSVLSTPCISLTFGRVMISCPLKGLSYNLLMIYYSLGCDLSTEQNHSSFCHTLWRKYVGKMSELYLRYFTVKQRDPEDGSVNKGLITGESQCKALAHLWVFVQ